MQLEKNKANNSIVLQFLMAPPSTPPRSEMKAREGFLICSAPELNGGDEMLLKRVGSESGRAHAAEAETLFMDHLLNKP